MCAATLDGRVGGMVGEGFERGHRAENAPQGRNQLPKWATRATLSAILAVAVLVFTVFWLLGWIRFEPLEWSPPSTTPVGPPPYEEPRHP